MVISIVTPSYNQGKFIKATLDSILDQDDADVELIVMDGGSIDETVDILKNYGDPRLTWVSERDKGQSDAINKGLRAAKGDILAYLNSDDLYLPGTLAYVTQYFADHPDVDVICGGVHQIDTHGNILERKLLLDPAQDFKRAFTHRLYTPQPGVFWRRRVTERIGLFDESLHYAMDYDYWLRMLLAGFKLTPVPRYLASFRLHDTSKTVSKDGENWRDWETIIDKVFAMPDLPPEVVSLRAYAYTYMHHWSAENLLKMGRYGEARPHIRHVLRHGDTLRLRLIASVMYIDSLFHMSLFELLVKIYRRAKGLK